MDFSSSFFWRRPVPLQTLRSTNGPGPLNRDCSTFRCGVLAAALAAMGAVSQAGPLAPNSALLAPRAKGCFAPIEAAFQLDVAGDPFDYRANDVRVTLRLPDGKTLSLPAFFDGGRVWRARHTPVAAGIYRVLSVARNGKTVKAAATPAQWRVGGALEAGWVRTDASNRRRLAFDSGARFYPLGTNQAWLTGRADDYARRFARLRASGQNWSRVWMNHWDGKNLDWPRHGALGTLDLNVARTWDTVVQSAAKNGIYFQMVLQHHGQYSTQVNPNWDDNPYNIKNGGFLQTPDEFFSNRRARDLTKRKLRYMVARYGFSPHILAWELWNEVQFSDAARAKNWGVVADWHREMAAFLRSQDVYGHLVTSSSDVPPEVTAPLDFYQRHSYPSDLISDLSQTRFVGAPWPIKPEFVGEYGDDATQNRPDEWTMHSGLWASLGSDAAGAGEYWYGDKVDKFGWYGHFKAASDFLRASDFAARDKRERIAPARVDIETPRRGALSLSPGGGWEAATQSEFDLSKLSDLEAFGRLPRYLQGRNHHEMNPVPLVLRFALPRAGELQIRIGSIAKAGATLRVRANGQERQFPFPATPADANQAQTLSIPLNAGRQNVEIFNTGQDWLVIGSLSIPGAVAQLGGFAKSAPDFALAWFFHRDNIEQQNPRTSSTGTATITGPRPGVFRVTWWDTLAGRALSTQLVRADARGLHLQIPPVTRDIAVWASAQPTPRP